MAYCAGQYLASPHEYSSSVGFPRREKPRLCHLLMGMLVSGFSSVLLLLYSRQLLLDAISQLLWNGKIPATRLIDSDVPELVVTLSDGSHFNLIFTWQRSGIVSILAFCLLFLFLMFPLSGTIWRKLVWLELGFVTGLIWSFIRLSAAVLVAYNFGTGAFTVADFLMGPFTDFLWMVSLWAVGLSTLVSTKTRGA